MSHKKAINAIRKEIGTYINLLHLSHVAIICLDEEQNIVVYNQGAENIFGYKAREILGKQLETLLPARYRKGHHNDINEFNHGEEISRLMNERLPITGLKKNGNEFTAQASISKFMYGGEKTLTVVLQVLTT